MTDLTPIFNKCVDIVTKEYSAVLPKPTIPKYDQYIIKDSFSKDCQEVYTSLLRLSAFVTLIKPLYLQNNDEYSRHENETKKLTAEEKNGIDEEFRLKVHQVNEKLKMFRTYELKRNELFNSLRKGVGLVLALFSLDEDDEQFMYNQTLTTHRAQVILFLNNTIHECNSDFEKMQRQRYERERQLNLLDFQNLDDDEDMDFQNSFKSDFKMNVVDKVTPFIDQENSNAISEELLQELTQENQELLLSKENQFKQVEKLQASMIDIVKLQSELTMHLETQGEQIGNLVDNQEQVELDLKQGNRTLKKATNRNKRGSDMIIATCIVLGLLLLFVDYIS